LAIIHQKLEMIVPVPVPTKVQVLLDASNPSIPMPNSFKPSPRSSFEVSNIPLSKGCAMTTGPVANLHLGSPERGDVSRRGSTAKCIGTRSSTMAAKALWLLQPAKGANEGYGNGSGHFAKHKKALRRGTVINMVVTNFLVIPPEITECLNLSGSRSSHCWERHSQHYTMHGEKIITIIWRRRVSWIHGGC
jgi:hypothetical protein